MNTYTCDTPLSGRTLFEQERLLSSNTPLESNTQRFDGSPKQQPPGFPVLGSHSPNKQLDAAQVDEALRLVSQWIHQGYECATPRQEQKNQLGSCTTTHTAGGEGNQTILSKGATRIKTWVKGGKYGPVFRVRRRLDSGHDVVTDLHFRPDKAGKRANKDSQDVNLSLLSEMDTTEQQICELPATETYELASEHNDPPSYSSIGHVDAEEQPWQPIEVPAVGGAVDQDLGSRRRSDLSDLMTALDSPRASADFYSGVTRLKSTTTLLHKLREERKKRPMPCLEEDESLYEEATPLLRPALGADSDADATLALYADISVVGEGTETALHEDEVQQPDDDKMVMLNSIWETLLVQQVFILGEHHLLVAKAKQDYESSKRLEHQKTNPTKSLRESVNLATRPLGLINPVLMKFSIGLQELEDLLREHSEGPGNIETCLRGPPESIAEFLSTLPLQNMTAMTPLKRSDEKASTAPVTPIDRVLSPTMLLSASKSKETECLTEVTPREKLFLRTSRSLPSLRVPSGADLRSQSQKDGITNGTTCSDSNIDGDPVVSLTFSEAPTAELQNYDIGVRKEVEETPTTLGVAGTSMHHRETSRRVSPSQTPFDNRSWPAGKSAAKTFSHLLLSSLLELVRQGTTALQHASGTEPIPYDHVRVHWRCACGAQLHDDFREIRAGAAEELEAQLNGVRMHSGNSNASSPSSAGPNSSASSIFSSSLNSTPSSATTWSANNSASNSPSRVKPMQILPSPPSTFSIPIPERNPPYLLTCANEGRFTPKLTHLDMGADKISNDKDLAMALRTHYFGLNNKWYHHLRLRGLTMVEFVRFQVHKNRFADIRKRPDMPGSDNRDYAFTPDLVPPVGSNYLIHLLNHPQDYEDECIAYERIPKKTSRIAAGECGWGIELVETFLSDRVWGLVLCVFGIGSLIFGVVWGARRHDVQGAFGVAAWVCGFAVLLIGWLQACLG